MEIKGIKYFGPIFDHSGYGNASRGYVLALNRLGVPLTLKPITFEKKVPDWGKTGEILADLVNKDIDYNIVILHTTPEFWEKHKEPGKINVGYCVWETTKLHEDWPKFINDNVDAVMVACEWNKQVFEDSGVKVPIFVVPHGMDMSEYDDIEPYSISGIKKDAYKFYNIDQWCYDDKTRVLTKDGFKYFKNLSYEDEIATFNKNTEELEYQIPKEIVRFKRKDKMASLTGHFFDICTTPDHKMLVRNKNSSEWIIKPFNELLSIGKKKQIIVQEKYRAKKNCKWTPKNEKKFFEVPLFGSEKYTIRKGFPNKISMDLFLEFLGWYLSEGSTYKAKDKRGYINVVTQIKNKNYINEIFNCIGRMGYRPFIRAKKDIVFHSKEIHYYLKQFGKAKNKFIPKWIKNLSSRQIEILLTSLFKGDGSLYKNGNWVKYTTTSKQLAEDVLECLLKIGLSGAISTKDPTCKKSGKIDGRYINSKSIQYTISVNRSCNEPSMYYANLDLIDYDGYIYGVTVPNHVILVERNGKVIFSGNTERKHPTALIKSYWAAFRNNENVALILKTYRGDFSDEEKNAVRNTILKLKDVTRMSNYPPIYLILDMLTRKEVLGLHKAGDCFVSLNRGEGFGLSGFEAGATANPAIVTGLGGVLEYAKPEHSYLVNYSLTPVFGMNWSPWYNHGKDEAQMWAEPDCGHAIELMRHVYSNQEEAKIKGEALKKYIAENLSWEKVGQKIINIIESL